MGLRILHSADWHLDSPFSSFSEEQRRLLMGWQKLLPGMIAEICRETGCDLMLLAGDLFDRVPCRDTLNSVKRALRDCGVPVFIAPGNHDHCGSGSVWQEESWPENVYIFTGGVEAVELPHLDCRIYGAGYQAMESPSFLKGFRAEGTRKYHIGVFHADPVTRDSPYSPVTAAQIRESGLDYLALGHIHSAGSVTAGDTLCVWPGCAMGRGWDEAGEKGVCIAELSDGIRMQFIPLPVPRFYDLETEGEPGGLLPAEGGRDFYRITLTGQREVDLDGLYREYSRFPNLFLRDHTEGKLDLWAWAEEDSLRGVYFRKLQTLAEKEPAAVLAAELSHRILQGKEVTLP